MNPIIQSVIINYYNNDEIKIATEPALENDVLIDLLETVIDSLVLHNQKPKLKRIK